MGGKTSRRITLHLSTAAAMTGGYSPWVKFNAHHWVFLNARRQPAGSKVVFERIHALAKNAAEEVPNIGCMAMPAEAKQMYLTMCRFMIRLGETASAAEDRNPYGVLDS